MPNSSLQSSLSHSTTEATEPSSPNDQSMADFEDQLEAFLAEGWHDVGEEIKGSKEQLLEQVLRLSAELEAAKFCIAELCSQIKELKETTENSPKSTTEENWLGWKILQFFKFSFFRKDVTVNRVVRTSPAQVLMLSCFPNPKDVRDLTSQGFELQKVLATKPPTTFFKEFLRTVYVNPSSTILELMEGLAAALAEQQFPRIPQFSSNNWMDLNSPFKTRVQQNGGTKILIVGAHYRGQRIELRDSVPEARNVKRWLFFEGFSPDPENLQVIADDGKLGRLLPTRQNILDGIAWLTAGARWGDSLFFLYTGHGVQEKRKDRKGQSRVISALLPIDYEQNGYISGETLLERLVQPLPRGVQLTVLMDCYHSSPALVLPYAFQLEPGATKPLKPEMGSNFCFIPEIYETQQS